jgi:hypothetical protein
MQLKDMEVNGVKGREKEKEDRKTKEQKFKQLNKVS